MHSSANGDLASVACITVTYNPDLLPLRRQFAALPAECLKVVVDNASNIELLREIEVLINTTPNASLIHNTENIGLAAATNAGVTYAHTNWPQAQFALLLDQDSEPRPGSIGSLVSAFRMLADCGKRPGCVGPTLIDSTTGLSHGFHQSTRWRWKRIYPAVTSATPVECVNLNGSGTLVPIELFMQLHGLDERLFIDHVDTEWAFRVLSKGYGLWGVPQAVFVHSMGLGGVRFWLFGWHVWPTRSAQRHYFLYRNAVILMRRKYVPLVWKVWAVAKLVITLCVTLVIGPDRRAQMSNMWEGVCAGHGYKSPGRAESDAAAKGKS